MMLTSVKLKTQKKDLKTRNRIAMMRAGYPHVTKLAKAIGKSRQWTSDVLYGRIKHDPTRQLIAEAVGKPLEYLWPTRRRKAA